MTFNSHIILRHMTKLLYVSGDFNLAKRTFKLYVQVVSKAYKVNADADTDKHWVETLVYGIRMLCRHASSLHGLDGVEEAKEAEALVERAYQRLDREDKKLLASVELAEGICQSVLALKRKRTNCHPAVQLLKIHQSKTRTRVVLVWPKRILSFKAHAQPIPLRPLPIISRYHTRV